MTEVSSNQPAESSEAPQSRPPARGSALARAWRLVRGEQQGPLARLLARRVTLRLGSRRRRAPLGIVLACVLVLVVAFAGLVVFVTPVFGARSVAVVGTKTLTVEQIRRAADISTGTPLARLDTGKVRSRILAIPEVRKATVLRSWPGTVRIKITERTPAAVIARNGQFVIVDSLGVPYQVEKTRPAELPLITIPNPNGVVIPNFASDPIPKKDKVLVAAAATARALTPELRAKLASVDAPDQRHIQLKLAGGRVFFWGSAEDPTENVRKATVATVLLNRPGKTVDVSTPGVVSVR